MGSSGCVGPCWRDLDVLRPRPDNSPSRDPARRLEAMEGFASSRGVRGCRSDMEVCRSFIKSSILDVLDGFRASEGDGLDRLLGSLGPLYWVKDVMAEDMDSDGVCEW